MLPFSLKNKTQELFAGKRFDVHCTDVQGEDGQCYRKDIIVHPGAVVILPILPNGQIALIRNYRIAVDQTLWELPAGTLEPPGEDPAVCAYRELIEETGYQAKNISLLTSFYSSPGICTEKMYCFLATDLKFVGQALEATEQITVEPRSIDTTLQMIQNGEIKDGKTIATILFHQQFQKVI